MNKTLSKKISAAPFFSLFFCASGALADPPPTPPISTIEQAISITSVPGDFDLSKPSETAEDFRVLFFPSSHQDSTTMFLFDTVSLAGIMAESFDTQGIQLSVVPLGYNDFIRFIQDSSWTFSPPESLQALNISSSVLTQAQASACHQPCFLHYNMTACTACTAVITLWQLRPPAPPTPAISAIDPEHQQSPSSENPTPTPEP